MLDIVVINYQFWNYFQLVGGQVHWTAFPSARKTGTKACSQAGASVEISYFDTNLFYYQW